jgi:hypothetical protein
MEQHTTIDIYSMCKLLYVYANVRYARQGDQFIDLLVDLRLFP